MKKPEPQKYIKGNALKIYDEICSHLSNVDALEDVDSYIISMAAYYLDLFMTHADAGLVQTFANGTRQVSPEHTLMKDAREGFIKLSAKIGLSNKDREAMLKFKGQSKEVDALDELQG